jgi:hypothetical protein
MLVVYKILLCKYDSFDLVILVLNICFYFCGDEHPFNYKYFYVHDCLQMFFFGKF